MRRRKTPEEIEEDKEERKLRALFLFRLAEIIAIILLCKYVWEENKPATELNPNDWDLPIQVEVVK